MREPRKTSLVIVSTARRKSLGMALFCPVDDSKPEKPLREENQNIIIFHTREASNMLKLRSRNQHLPAPNTTRETDVVGT